MSSWVAHVRTLIQSIKLSNANEVTEEAPVILSIISCQK